MLLRIAARALQAFLACLRFVAILVKDRERSLSIIRANLYLDVLKFCIAELDKNVRLVDRIALVRELRPKSFGGVLRLHCS